MRLVVGNTPNQDPGMKNLFDVNPISVTESCEIESHYRFDIASIWQRLIELVHLDPILRLHCAIQPPPDLLDLPDRVSRPYPAHPMYQGDGTLVGLGELLETNGERSLLENILTQRKDQSLNPVDFTVEYFVRPLLVVFRRLLDKHGLVSLGLAGRNVAFELSPQQWPTGRIAITDVSTVYARKEVIPLEVQDAVNELHSVLNQFGTVLLSVESCQRGHYKRSIRALLNQVMTEEFRFLNQETAELLRDGQR